MPPKGKNGEANTIIEYLRRTNRPYSALDVFNNLKQEKEIQALVNEDSYNRPLLAKNNVQKVLTTLVEEGKISGKQYGKQFVYVCRQDEFETPSAEEMEEMDANIEKIKETILAIKEENKTLTAELASLNNSMTDDQIRERLKVLAVENGKAGERLKLLKNGAKLVNDDDRRKIDQDFDMYRKYWQVRRRMFREAWGTVTENLPDKPAELMEKLGIETDEMHGMDFNRDWTADL
ncbi:hypothetical protein SmJEL517_g02878 [Synchytrium microbalum]|uniref:Homologous-pairing protein 2 homolog n=1 Tax=Synchytrium microbalum TaxID=1806994 RepID=A0A507C4H7_9FUNG|nr:uncharacterized protein SmJEL517_g02878 [Synchytrium microbalum]TPX34572.1 hypothetical protein SmJEL517_g02878 [Synchytrium microbalum]